MAYSTKERILDALMSKKDYISGEELAEAIGVSRTSVWKHINTLRKEGYEILSVTNKGYMLDANPVQLSESGVSHLLKPLGFDTVRFYDSIDSTNLEAKRQANHISGEAVFISMEQTAGKGRRGRTWVSPKNAGIYMSLLLRPSIEPREASQLTLLAALAVQESVGQAFQVDVQIKWPNDLVLDKKKVCGILTEMSAEIDYLNYVVIGIGINIEKQQFPEDISHMATSIGNQLEGPIQTEQLNQYIYGVCSTLKDLEAAFEGQRNLSFVKEKYEKACVNVGQTLSIHSRQGEYIGEGLGINPTGELLVKQADGTIQEVQSGEVSVRGIYGYV